MADVKKTVKKVEVKKEKKNTEALEKKEVAYKKLIWFVPRITAFVEEWKNAKILNDKAKVYTKMLNLLYTSVSMLLNQNLNTYTNSLYINDILAPELQNLRKKFQDSREAVYNKVWWRDKFESMVNKINKALEKLWDPKKIKNPTQEQKDLLKLIEQNAKLRTQVDVTVDLKKAIQQKRSVNIKQKHVLEIYEKAVLPILNFLLKEPEINQKDLKDLDALLKTYVKEWTLDSKKTNFWIKITYWPKEAVYNNWKQFWYRWVIWNQFTEMLMQKEWWAKLEVWSWKEYLELFKEWMEYEKVKLTNKNAKAPAKQLYYPYFKSLILNDHVKMQKLMKKFVETLIVKFEKTKKVDQEVLDSLKEVSERMVIWTMELQVSRKWWKYIIAIQKNNKDDKKEVKAEVKKEAPKKAEVKKAEPKKVDTKKEAPKKDVKKVAPKKK